MAKGNLGSRRPGGGPGSRVNVAVGVRNGKGAQEMRVRGVSLIGSALGNHSTDRARKLGGASERIQGARLPAALSVPLGNAVALDVGAGGPGAGRDFVSRSGSNCVSGPVNPGASRPGANKPIFPGFK